MKAPQRRKKIRNNKYSHMVKIGNSIINRDKTIRDTNQGNSIMSKEIISMNNIQAEAEDIAEEVIIIEVADINNVDEVEEIWEVKVIKRDLIINNNISNMQKRRR